MKQCQDAQIKFHLTKLSTVSEDDLICVSGGRGVADVSGLGEGQFQFAFVPMKVVEVIYKVYV